jgi:hypothetical protein
MFRLKSPSRRVHAPLLCAALVAGAAVADDSIPLVENQARPVHLPSATVPHGAMGADGLVIDFDDALDNDEIAAIAKELGLAVEDTTEAAAGNLFVLRGDASLLQRAKRLLSGHRGVETVEDNVAYGLFDQDLEAGPVTFDGERKPSPTKPDDPMYKSQWHFTMVNAEGAWQVTKGEGVIVAVIDTGVSPGKLADGRASRFKRVPDLNADGVRQGLQLRQQQRRPLRRQRPRHPRRWHHQPEHEQRLRCRRPRARLEDHAHQGALRRRQRHRRRHRQRHPLRRRQRREGHQHVARWWHVLGDPRPRREVRP